LTHKAIPVAVDGSNFGKSSINKYKRVIYDLKINKKCGLSGKFVVLFRLTLRLCGTILVPPIMVQSKKIFPDKRLESPANISLPTVHLKMKNKQKFNL
jgi:hypothetical protein